MKDERLLMFAETLECYVNRTLECGESVRNRIPCTKTSQMKQYVRGEKAVWNESGLENLMIVTGGRKKRRKSTSL